MDICCGIVLYNPDIKRLKENIQAIEEQVSKIVVIDNGSSNIEKVKSQFSYSNNIIISENYKNQGIAYALNQIMEFAEKNGYQWVLALDQDSICDKNLISVYQTHIKSNIGILCPKIIDLNKQEKNDNSEYEDIYDSSEVITSGSLIQVDAWRKVGRFDDRLFIDFVDTEFQERIIRFGYKIIRINKTYIFHEIGKMREIKIGSFVICCSNHSAFRRYYMVRNRLYFKRKYYGWRAYFKEKIRLILGDIKILIFEKEKGEKIKASIRGYRDYRTLLK